MPTPTFTPARRLEELLGLQSSPVAVAFRPDPPAGVPRVDSAAPSGCTYWKLAAEGRVFYTEAADHYGCPVGSYTHGIALPPERRGELEGLVGTMLQLGYLRESEIPAIPQRPGPFGVAVYAPWTTAPCEPDVILVRGDARQMMLLAEAVRAAGIGDPGELMGRPTCAMIPAATASGQARTSLGCIGNRVYTGMSDGELYAAIPAAAAVRVIEQLAVIVEANRQLETFHRSRLGAATA